MAHQIAVLGLGRFGLTLANELYQMGHDVLAVDREDELSQSVIGQVTYSVTGDVTSPELLEEIGLTKNDTELLSESSHWYQYKIPKKNLWWHPPNLKQI